MLKFFARKKTQKESLMAEEGHRKSAHFHALKISDIRKETKDTVSVAFELPAEREAEYTFEPGQYLTLKTEINGEEVRRSYSICSSHQKKDELRKRL